VAVERLQERRDSRIAEHWGQHIGSPKTEAREAAVPVACLFAGNSGELQSESFLP